MRKSFTILLFTFFYFSSVLGRNDSENPTFSNFKLTIKEGLPSNIIWNLNWDSNDNLWLATQAGLVYYNGVELVNTQLDHQIIDIQKSDLNSLNIFDQYGDIYQISSKNQVQKYLTNEHNPRNYYQNYAAFPLEKELFKKIYSRYSNNLFNWYSGKTLRIDQETLLLLQTIDNTATASTFKIINNDIQLITTQKLPHIHSLFVSNAKIYLIEKGMKIIQVDHHLRMVQTIQSIHKPKFKNPRFFPYNGVSNICVQDNSNIYNLSVEHERAIWKIVSVNTTQDIVKTAIYNPKMLICAIATEANGVVISKENKVQILKPIYPTNTQSFYIQIPINKTHILTTDFGIIGPKPFKRLVFPTTIDKQWITDKKGRIWYSGQDYVSYFEPKTFKTKKVFYSPGKGGWAFCNIEELKKIIAYNTGGIYCIDSQFKVTQLYDNHKKFDPNDQPNFMNLIDGVIYIGTNNGIIKYHYALNKMEYIGKPEDRIRGIYKIQNKIVVCNYGKGIQILKNNQLSAPILDFHQYFKYVHGIYVEDNQVWISTNNGIVYGNNLLLHNIIHQKNIFPYCHYINFQNGLESVELNGGGKFSIMKFGNTLNFVSTNGLVRINPKYWSNYSDTYAFNLKFYDLNGNDIEYKKGELHLSANTKYVKCVVKSNNWNTSFDNRYLYRWQNSTHILDGSKPLIITINTENHGLNKFSVYKYIGNGNKILSNTVVILTDFYWYETWWGVMLSLFGTGLLIYLIIKIRTHRIQKLNLQLNKVIEEQTKELLTINKELETRNEKKSHILSIIGHDLFVPLKFLSQTGNAMVKNYDHMDQSEIIEIMKSISGTSDRLALLCKNILNWIQYDDIEITLSKSTFPVQEVIKNVDQIISLAANQKGNKIVYLSKTAQQKITTNFDALGIVLLNVVSNANRFSEHSEIIIDTQVNKTHLEIKISDQGKGMSDDLIEKLSTTGTDTPEHDTDFQKSSGIGYHIIHEILRTVNGNISIAKSTSGIGTDVTIYWPID